MRLLDPHPPHTLTRGRASQARKAQQSDANADACALCGLGGSLICCDGCPAAYHVRCVGESYRGINDSSEWLCPECSMGVRSAGGRPLPLPLALGAPVRACL